jgi:hypothetical protein
MRFNPRIRPINIWPGTETKAPRSSPFRSTYLQTKELLAVELDALNAIESSPLIEMFVDPAGIYADGSKLKAHVKPYKPGVILSFVRRVYVPGPGPIGWKDQPLRYPCDAFDNWRDNLRAIALSLESLRRVARYGVFSVEQMANRLALPEPTGDDQKRTAAAVFLARHSGFNANEILNGKDLASAYREAAKRLHPDKGGDRDLWENLQLAKAIFSI